MCFRTEAPVLRVEVWEGSRAATVRLFGELVDDSAAPVLALLEEELRGSARGETLLDLRGLTFIDSSGIAMVLAVADAARSAARDFSVIRGPRQVQRLLRLAGADRRLRYVLPARR